MPWTEEDVSKHSKKAGRSSKRRKMWSKVANSVLKRTGDEAQAVRTANGVVKKGIHKKKTHKRVSKK